MPVGGSRTYKLCLSDAGLDQFLACHARLGTITRELVPYGATLFVALSVADRLSAVDLAAELTGSRCTGLVGRLVRYVGFTGHLGDLTSRTCERLVGSGVVSRSPRVNRIYAVGILCLSTAEEVEVNLAYEHLRDVRGHRDG